MKVWKSTRTVRILKNPEEEHPCRGYHDYKYDDPNFELAFVAYSRGSRFFTAGVCVLTDMANRSRSGCLARGLHW